MSHQISNIDQLAPLVGYHLRRASGAFSADFAQAMEGTGIRQVLLGILAVIGENPGVNQGTVGRLLSIKRANMVSLINELVDRGLVQRAVDPDDRRAFSLELTDDGRVALAESLARIEVHEQRMLSSFTKEERATLLKLLEKIERSAVVQAG